MWFIRHFRNSQSRVLLHTYWTRIFIITSFSCDSYVTKMGSQCMETQWAENRSKRLLWVNTLLPGTVSLLPEHKPPGMRPALMASMISRPDDDVMAIFRLANRPHRWEASAWCVYNYSEGSAGGHQQWPAVRGMWQGLPLAHLCPTRSHHHSGMTIKALRDAWHHANQQLFCGHFFGYFLVNHGLQLL